jgi:hypothetical protein
MELISILSQAKTSGKRAAMAVNPGATFGLATRLRTADGAPIGEVFEFLSGLYFRPHRALRSDCDGTGLNLKPTFALFTLGTHPCAS